MKRSLLLSFAAAASGSGTSIYKVDYPEKGHCGMRRNVPKTPGFLDGGFIEGTCADVGYLQYLHQKSVAGASGNVTIDVYASTQTETIDLQLKDPARQNRNVKLKLCMPYDIGTTPHPHPLLVFGSGDGIDGEEYQYFCQTAATAMVYSDDSKVADLALDAKFLAEKLMDISKSDESSPLYQKLDGRVVIGGHSVGGDMGVLSVGKESAGVTGIALYAPALDASGTSYLKNIEVPALIVSGSMDCGDNALDKQAQPAFDGIASKKKILVVLKGANHCQWAYPFGRPMKGVCKSMEDECHSIERFPQQVLGTNLAHNFMWALQGQDQWDMFEDYLAQGEKDGTWTYFSSVSSPKQKKLTNECPCQKSAQAPSQADLVRARTKKPREDYKGADQTGLSKVLNQHMGRSESTMACLDWTVEKLQGFMATVLEHRSEALQQIYDETSDRRKMYLSSGEEYSSLWKKLNGILSRFPHLMEIQKESHCREAVMWWTHHLSEDKRQELRARNVTVPLLPEGPKKACGQSSGEHKDVLEACQHYEKPNSCDWCHSQQSFHDAGVPGTTPLNGSEYSDGPDDGNPHGWDRWRRCDQDQLPRCQLCEGVGGMAWTDNNSDYIKTPCEIVAKASDVDPKTVAPPLYPKRFTVKRKDGKRGGYSDTLIGWEVMNSCFSFFPQNDSIGPLCYRSEEAIAKYYDIEREAARSDYTLALSGMPPGVPNTSSTILQVGSQMWIVNDIAGQGNIQCVCTNPSGQHCVNENPCYSYLWRWNTFETAQYLGREKIGVEWIQDHGVGNSSKIMELDHFILWSHHLWTDPKSRRLVRAWKPFNGLQVYDPEAWLDDIEDVSVLDSPPPVCKKPAPGVEVWRIHCDDDGNYNGTDHTHRMFGETFSKQIEEIKAKVLKQLAAKNEIII